MPYEILIPIKHGAEGKIYELEVGDIVPNDFFSEEQIKSLFTHKAMRESLEKPGTPLPSGTVEELIDLSSMTVAVAKELLEAETDVTRLTKYLDQESHNPNGRRSMTEFIERKIKYLTGYE